MRSVRSRFWFSILWCGGLLAAARVGAQVPIEGFLPMVGMTLTDEYQIFDDSATFFISEPAYGLSGGANLLGQGSGSYYDVALLDTGAATHIITSAAATGFDIDGEGFDGVNLQTVGGATGLVDMRIEDPLGVYMAGLSNRTSAGNSLTLNNNALRGQTSFAVLSAPPEWTLPNIMGMPMAAHHQIQIRNSNPQIFELNGRTVRTPDVQTDFLGADNHGIQRRAPLVLNNGIGFVQGPFYLQNLDLDPFNPNFDFHEDPLSPSVVENGTLGVEIDMVDGANVMNDQQLLFDTGASLTVISEQMAVRLGFDPILDTPEFEVQVEGSGGVGGSIPGFYLDELSIDTIGGTFELQNVPVAVLDVANPADPGNVIDGILGMNAFIGRDLVIDANPQVGQGGTGPSLFISDPVTQSRLWGTTAASGSWTTPGNWFNNGVPDTLWDVTVANVRGSDQTAMVSTSSTIFRATISGETDARMTVQVANGVTLNAFADLTIKSGGHLQIDGGHVDAQFIDIPGGTLSGTGTVFVGSGPITGQIRIEAGGRLDVAEENGPAVGTLEITGGDLAVGIGGTVSFDLAGTGAGTGHDQLIVDRFAFLSSDSTLDVSLVDGFTPQVGQTFTLITTGEGVLGTFSDTNLPAGYSWDVDYIGNSVRIEVTGLGLVGDLNGDGMLDCVDANLLSNAVAGNVQDIAYDMDGSGQVDQADLVMWIEDIKGTLIGDADLNGVVDGQDFIAWNQNKFTNTADWCGGDFNGDGVVDGQDFIAWNGNKFTSADGVQTVPEPAVTGWLFLLVWCGWRHIGARRVCRP